MTTLLIILISLLGIYACYYIIKETAIDMPIEFGENHADEEMLERYLKREKLRRMTKDIEDEQPGDKNYSRNLKKCKNV